MAIASSWVVLVACGEDEANRNSSLDASLGAANDGALDAPRGNSADAPLQIDVGQDVSARDEQDAAGVDANADAAGGDAAVSRVKINFEAVNGVTPGPISGSVPVIARLSDQLQPLYGVVFRSAAKPYVALVSLGAGHATSGVNGIGSVSATDTMAYATMTVTFTIPGNPAVAAVTDFVSLRGDQIATSGTATLEAFDKNQVSLGKVTVADTIAAAMPPSTVKAAVTTAVPSAAIPARAGTNPLASTWAANYRRIPASQRLTPGA